MSSQAGAAARREEGAVAILVALSMSTFLLGFAALAVDLGQVYARRGELQSVADLAALAGAARLPDVAGARAAAVETLCSDANRVSGWDASVCPADGAAPAWTRDGTPDNGELVFYGEDTGDDGVFDRADQVPPDAAAATALRVLLPRSTVEFGPAASLGADHIALSRAATARIGTPLGTGLLPFAVSTADLDPLSQNRFCVRDPAARRVRGADRPRPGRGGDPCSRPHALRGYLDVARDGGGDPARTLTENIRTGVQPTVQRWPLASGALPSLAGKLGAPGTAGLHCDALNERLGGLVEPLVTDDALLGYVNCAEVRTQDFAGPMTAGLLGGSDGAGHLQRRCGDERETVRGVTIDGTDLFADGSRLVRRGPGFGSAAMLRHAIRSGAEPVPGWITSEAMQCPRLVTMPVVDTSTFTDGGYPVVDLTYAWIEDDDDGLLWRDGRTLAAFRGYVIDPGYFPGLVTGSPVVGEYLGDHLPKQAVLVRDIGPVP